MEDDVLKDCKYCEISMNSPPRIMNDPWKPIDQHTETLPTIVAAPKDPLRCMISSENYIKSLEKRLSKISKKSDVVKPKDMIQCLQSVKDLHTSELMSNQTSSEYLTDSVCDTNESVITSIQRKLNPERQALGALELVPLVTDDILSKTVEQPEDLK